MISVNITLLKQHREVTLPEYATLGSAGMDLCADLDRAVMIEPSQTQLIPTGIAIALPIGFEAQIRPRSGNALKYGITVLNSPGTIDSDYRGEIKILLINHGKEVFMVEPTMRIAQLVVARYARVSWNQVDDLGDTIRGKGGFGSTGN